LRGFVTLAWTTATTAATATTPAAVAIGSGCAFAEIGSVRIVYRGATWGSCEGDGAIEILFVEVGTDRVGRIQRCSSVGAGLAITVAATVATATAATISASTTVTALRGASTGVGGLVEAVGWAGYGAFEGGRVAVAVATAVAAAFATGGTAVVAIGVEVGGVAGLFYKVGDVEEGVALKADVHEGGLHSGQHAGNFAVVDGAREGVFVLALVIDFGEGVVLDDSETGLMGGTGDINFFRHSLCSFCPTWLRCERQTRQRTIGS
jgi:hypothetical protein